MSTTPGNVALDAQQIIAELQRKLDEAHAELAARNSAYSERIAYQAAANDVLKVMSASPGDPQPVFDLISVRARDICDAYGVTVCEFDGSLLHWRAATGISDDPAVREAAKAAYPTPPTRDLLPGRAILTGAIVHIRDHDADPELRRFSLTVKSSVVVPLMRGGVPIGTLHMGSRERGGFSDAQVELLETFADQAVIAIENARLFNQVRERTVELSEALQQKTATADVLKVISRSAFKLDTVLETLISTATSLCNCGPKGGQIFRREGDVYRYAASQMNVDPDYLRHEQTAEIKPGRGTLIGRVALWKRTVMIADAWSDPEYEEKDAAQTGNVRAMLGVPLLRDGEPIGAFALARSEPIAFTEREVELVTSFADQAVIAIENARLFNEVQERTVELSEALQQQTATADVLKVISSSPGELKPVFQSLLKHAVHLCDAEFGMLFLPEEDDFRAVGKWNLPIAYGDFLENNTIRADPRIPLSRAVITKQPVQVADILVDQSYVERHPGIVAVAEGGGARTLLQVPMLKENELVGTIGIYRQEVRPFSDKQIALVQNFAAQAVIAIENASLLNELRQRTDDLTRSLNDLRTAQDRLIQTEKLASLGQLTAGIAHEIKNPLNFVNNFSALSAELVGEMNDVLAEATLDKKTRSDLDELAQTLKSNLEKVVQHGRRADSIVKNMLQHSREGSGEHRPTGINAIVDESLNLAYHGARAEKAGFSVIFQRDLDPSVGMADIYPQEITRVLLNLISNGFYAMTKRKAEAGDGFEPVLCASTKNLVDKVEIRIRDNGTGIPDDVKEKIFNPFFTTKPSGEGTGLGLSMSHDIIVKQHGGSIEVETQPGRFTEFKIVLPRTNQSYPPAGSPADSV